MKRVLGILLFCGYSVFSLLAQENATKETAPAKKMEEQFGDWIPILMKNNYVEKVTVEGNSIMVKLAPPYREKAIIVRISDGERSQYRYWLNNGKIDFPVKVYRTGEKEGYTYRIHTSANFLEYWDGETLFLHLTKVKE